MTSYKYTKTKLIYGIGINDADYPVLPRLNGKQAECPFYRKWKHMLLRCYSDSFHTKQPTYVGCSVVPEWHSFMAFRDWMKTQDWEGKELDKDILVVGNKVYGPDFCIFITVEINNLINEHKGRKRDFPTGVWKRKDTAKFSAGLSICGKTKHLGYFDDIEQASAAYKKAKRINILKIACCEPSVIIKQALFRHSELLR